MASKPPRSVDGTIQKLGAKLEALRTARGWTQEEVGRALGYANHTPYTKLETGAAKRPSARRVLMLAKLYDVSVDVLVRDELQVPPEALETP